MKIPHFSDVIYELSRVLPPIKSVELLFLLVMPKVPKPSFRPMKKIVKKLFVKN